MASSSQVMALGLVSSLLLLSCSSDLPVEDQDTPLRQAAYEAPPLPPDLEGQVDRTKILWLKGILPKSPSTAPAIRLELLAQHFAAETDSEIVSIYSNLGGFALVGDPAVIKEKAESPPWLPIFDVGSDFVVSGYSAPGCSGPVPLPQDADIPIGVERVGGPLASGPGTAWILDSGIDATSAEGQINIDYSRAASCLDAPENMFGGGCVSGFTSDMSDVVGHGTMIAGIIGAMPRGDVGLSGVAPGATVVPIKVFGETAYADFARGPLRALDHLVSVAKPGDVVNISWGGNWRRDLRTFLTTYHRVNRAIRDLADRGVRFAIAAGNQGEWVQFISPAGAGAYRSANGGAVVTVSAVESEPFLWFFWRDQFWPYSNYGAGNPDYAEPGVNITSLWPSNQVNTCSGTSFAAPHMAGILLNGLPRADGRAKGDPDGVAHRRNRDPIGRCCAR